MTMYKQVLIERKMTKNNWLEMMKKDLKIEN